MKIVLKESNYQRITQELEKVAKKSKKHTFTEAFEVDQAVYSLIKVHKRLGITRKDIAGSKYNIYSGEPVPSAYRHTRQGTVVEVTFTLSGVNITNIQRCDLYPNEGGECTPVHISISASTMAAKFKKLLAL